MLRRATRWRNLDGAQKGQPTPCLSITDSTNLLEKARTIGEFYVLWMPHSGIFCL